MQPQGSTPNYDFIMKDSPPSKRSLLPSKNPILIICGIVVLILLVIVAFGVVNSNKKNAAASGLLEALGRVQEINRVTAAQVSNLKDPSVSSLAATIQASTNTEKAQLNNYLVGQKIKIDKNKLAAYQNKNTDTQMASALQNNSLDSAYLTYLKSALSAYSQSLKAAYPSAGPNAKIILQDAFDSTQTLLSSPPLKS